ncbi:hypothetical protein [Ohtaekwangia koreensis]|uniref:RiboL-PSP-HEPN domain-containing protein n=1 Tax=Ohtaekwangia koreensis TaxID=688867 RepID=A0A1T5J940_9BACT|nr:hypothetical protein [Ohtaekwangia koreensis]SKC47772.1 hypothetical protein SAMN05660236_0871 [Ohtaekwangia koreensis]
MNQKDRSKPESLIKFIENATAENFIKEYAAMINLKKRYETNIQLVFEIEEKASTEELKSHARRLAHVYFVSILEMFLKELIYAIYHWNIKGRDELLEKQSYNLAEAFEVFKERELVSKEITKEYLIAHFNSFQSLQQIEFVFDRLTGKKFFNAISNYSKNTNSGNKDVDISRTLIDFFAVRNKIVHECNIEPYSIDKMKTNAKFIYNLLIDISNYCESTDHNYKG